MKETLIGKIAVSKAGHDQNQFFVILKAEDEYVYLVDGKVRTLDRPKKKKIKHIQLIDHSVDHIIDAYKENKLMDSHVRKAIKQVIALDN